MFLDAQTFSGRANKCFWTLKRSKPSQNVMKITKKYPKGKSVDPSSSKAQKSGTLVHYNAGRAEYSYRGGHVGGPKLAG
jgi:hypothetical protein